MALVDPYAPCPCGSGQKFKWCCHKVEAVAERAQRLFESGQTDAAVEAIDEGLKKEPNNAWLLTRKALYLTREGKPDPAKAAIRLVLEKNPRHIGAQMLMTRLVLETEGPSAGAAQLQQALTAVPAAQRGSLAGLVKVVGAFLAEAGEVPAALKHLKLVQALDPSGQADPAVTSTVRALEGNPGVAPWLKNPDPIVPAPDGLSGEARARFEQAASWAGEGLWSSAAAAFETLSSDPAAGPLADRNLGFCRLWLADQASAVPALRRYGSRLGASAEAVDIEALCQQVAPPSDDALVELVQLLWPVRDRKALVDTLKADPTVYAEEPAPIDPEDPNSPVVEQFCLLDRPRIDRATPDLKIAEIPRIEARCYLGPDNVAMEVFDDGRLERLSERFTALAGSSLPPAHPKTKTVSKVPLSSLALAWDWLLPEGVPAEQAIELDRQQGRHMIEAVWPETPHPALRGRTPLQAARAGDAEVPLRAAVLQFELGRESWRPGFDFAAFRARLNIPAEPEIDPETVDPATLHLARLGLIPIERLSDEKLANVYRRAPPGRADRRDGTRRACPGRSARGDGAGKDRTADRLYRPGLDRLGPGSNQRGDRLDSPRPAGGFAREAPAQRPGLGHVRASPRRPRPGARRVGARAGRHPRALSPRCPGDPDRHDEPDRHGPAGNGLEPRPPGRGPARQPAASGGDGRVRSARDHSRRPARRLGHQARDLDPRKCLARRRRRPLDPRLGTAARGRLGRREVVDYPRTLIRFIGWVSAAQPTVRALGMVGCAALTHPMSSLLSSAIRHEPSHRARIPVSQPHDEARQDPTTTATLVQQGWQHLQRQRPLAAWASWQRALRLAPNDPAARAAVESLETDEEWPAVARAVYRFQTPVNDATRARWDARFRGQNLEELDDAAEVFATLTSDNPADADAWLNLALCRAWLGQNTEAIASLDRVVSLQAADLPERARDAWTLAEVLRQGGGAEALADDFRYAWIIEGRRLPDEFFERWLDLVRREFPADEGPVESSQVFEWLDRPKPIAGTHPERAFELPRVLATVIRTAELLLISSPDPSGFALLDELASTPLGRTLAGARRQKAPLAIIWADLALANFRFPPGLDEDEKARLTRAAVEHYFENLWIHQPRQALGGASPLEASRAAGRGDVVARAKLSGVVRYREQLGSRSTHAAIYQGYPFDRLRRRLGLLNAAESASIDVDDASCMSEPELDALDPDALDGHRLAEAFLSAAGLRDDARTARFAGPLIRLGATAIGRLDLAAVVAPVVREALRLGDPEVALEWLKTAGSIANPTQARVFRVWSAEIHVRIGAPDESLRLYQELLAPSAAGSDALLALDGAETLLDRGYPDQALPLLREARDRARIANDAETLRKAEFLLDRDSGETT